MCDFKPLTLANMRLNGVHSVVASCPNCGRSADVNVDLLPETLSPRSANGSAAGAAAARRTRPTPLGIRAHGRVFLIISANGRRCPNPEGGGGHSPSPSDGDRHGPDHCHQHRRHDSGDLQLGGQIHSVLREAANFRPSPMRGFSCLRCDPDHAPTSCIWLWCELLGHSIVVGKSVERQS
jgi:hypothetical protein